MPRGIVRQRIWASDELRILQKLYEECYRVVIQKVPSSHNRPRGIRDTTCRHSDRPNKVTPPGSYRASLEKLGDCDPANNVIGYEAIDSLKNVRKTTKGSQGRRGLGANGQEWWCLKCLESLFVDLRELVWKHKSDGSTLSVHPLISIQYWIIPERRTIPQYDGVYYTLQPPQIHLLAKWQAVKTFDELRDRPAEGHVDFPEDPADGPISLYLGHDAESFYLDQASRDFRGVLADDRICESDATNVRGYSLSEALRRLDQKENRMIEEKWKPIMAERKRHAEGKSEERQYADAQLAGSSKEQEKAPASKDPEESGAIVFPVAGQRRHAMSVIYMGNELPEKSGKRKREDLDQSEDSPRQAPSHRKHQGSRMSPEPPKG